MNSANGMPELLNQNTAYQSPGSYFEAVQNAFIEAERTADVSTSHYFDIDSQIVWMQFAGNALASRVTPALDHLSCPPSDTPHLTIYLWDSVSTNYPFPLHPWSSSAPSTFRDGFRQEEERILYHDDRYRMYFYLAEMMLMLDFQQGKAVFWVEDARQLDFYERGAPLRSLLDWWFSGYDRQFAHAAAVGTSEGGVLLIGKGGSGKSTSALSCLDSPLQIAGDDSCIVGSKPTPYVHSLYNSAKLHPENLQNLPHLRDKITNSDMLDTEKAMFYLHRSYSRKFIKKFPLSALLVPNITGERHTSFRPASPAACLIALAPSTIFQLVNLGETPLQFMSRLVRKLPSYHLDLGTDLDQIPHVIMDILKIHQKHA
jgi:hypothetical protein